MSNTVHLNGYLLVDCDSEYTFHKQIISTSDRLNKTVPVHENDIFIATGWGTAYTISTVIKWQSEIYNRKVNPLIYFIQYYEPGFYAWSSRYLMVESTYNLDIRTFAIFNSTLLREFFNKNNYKFEKEWSFDPSLNEKLLTHLKSLPSTVKKEKANTCL